MNVDVIGRKYLNRYSSKAGKLLCAWVLCNFLAAGILYAGTNVWTSIGPDGGNIRSVVIDPGNPLIIYAVTGIGIYKSVNGGASWTAINKGLEDKFISSLAIDPHDSSKLYASSSKKLYKSTNGGNDWSVLAEFSASIIGLDPSNAAVMYAADNGGILKSSDGGSSWFRIYSLHQYKYPGPISSLVLDPTHSETLYAAESANYNSVGWLYKSTDGGMTWIQTSLLKSIACLAIDPQTPNTVYACAFYSGFFKSLDGGATWTEIIRGTGHWDFYDVRIHPSIPNEIYGVSRQAGFFRSQNGGVDWQEMSPGAGNKKYIHSFIFDPITPSTLYAASWDFGVLKSVDQGAHWAEINTNIRNISIIAIAVAPSHPDTLYACAWGEQYYIFATTDGGKSWQRQATAPTHNFKTLCVDPISPSTLYAGGSDGIFKSTDSGMNWDPILDGLPSCPDIQDIVINSKDRMTVFAVSLTYGASSSDCIYKSTDGGGSWKEAMNGLPLPYPLPGGRYWVDFLVPDPTLPNVLYAGISSGSYRVDIGLFKTSDAGANWAKISYLTGDALAVDPVRPFVLYLVNRSYVLPGVIYRSSDGGGSWSILYAGREFGSLIIHPLRTSVMYARNMHDYGISISVDGGAYWRAFSVSEGLDELRSTCLAVNPKSPEILYLSTYDGGVYKLDFDVTEYPPTIALNRKTLNFGGTTDNLLTGSQSVTVSNAGGGTLNWTATPSHAWITVNPGFGMNAGMVDIGVQPSGLPPGHHTGFITISAPNAVNNPQMINISLIIYSMGGWTFPPFGYFDTPIDGTMGITGAIPVSGWVLDDIETTKVEIWRDAVAGETEGIWKIGDAIFVEGARPDVEQACPDYPLNYRAGWGYMLLTNMLPAQGNGTYKLYANAYDKEGNKVLLGTKTIVCDNAHAINPFGTIDSPTQGGNASGNPYLSFGWVLTPLTKTVPKNGSTILVYVDGAYVGNLATAPNVYDQYRVDVATAFPGLNNSGGPVGAFYLDTTKYANGVHTIHWIAADDAGQTDGIGSRYFNIVNTGTSNEKPEATESLGVSEQPRDMILPQERTREFSSALSKIENILNMPLTFEPLRIRTGFDLKAGQVALVPDNYGAYHVEIPEVNRLEIELGATSDSMTALPVAPRYQGYLIVGDELRPLPVGSTLDARTGRFSWMPGPGFLGTYDLLFLQTDEFGITRRIPVKVTIKPKF